MDWSAVEPARNLSSRKRTSPPCRPVYGSMMSGWRDEMRWYREGRTRAEERNVTEARSSMEHRHCSDGYFEATTAPARTATNCIQTISQSNYQSISQSINQSTNKKHLKMLGPFATASRRTPTHQVSLLAHASYSYSAGGVQCPRQQQRQKRQRQRGPNQSVACVSMLVHASHARSCTHAAAP